MCVNYFQIAYKNFIIAKSKSSKDYNDFDFNVNQSKIDDSLFASNSDSNQAHLLKNKLNVKTLSID